MKKRRRKKRTVGAEEEESFSSFCLWMALMAACGVCFWRREGKIAASASVELRSDHLGLPIALCVPRMLSCPLPVSIPPVSCMTSSTLDDIVPRFSAPIE